jgi:hypothetical protein
MLTINNKAAKNFTSLDIDASPMPPRRSSHHSANFAKDNLGRAKVFAIPTSSAFAA